MSRNDNIIMSHTRSKWWTRLWPESEDTGALLIDFFTVWAPGLECRSSVLGADAPLGALTAENHMRVLVPSRPWTRLDYSQPHIIALNALSNIHFGFYKIPQTLFFFFFLQIFNAFDWLLNYNRQNQYPSMVLISIICFHPGWPGSFNPGSPRWLYFMIFSCDQAALWMGQSVCYTSFTMFPSS